MNTLCSALLALFISFVLFPGHATHADTRGAITGGVQHDAPSWFKESFLEIREDVDEANEENRHVMLFFQLNACPYCDRMLSESFEPDDKAEFIQTHFDTIAINVGGDREVVFNEQVSLIEKELAEMLEVRATPAILFLNSKNQPVVRVNGYRAPERFRLILDYVKEKAYENNTLEDYVDTRISKDIYTFKANPMFTTTQDLSAISGPSALIFEDGGCYDCAELHRTLALEEVQAELAPFTLVRLDADSDAPLVDFDGSETTAKALTRKYEMRYRPGVLIFDNGELIRRYDSLLYPHHFKEGFRYVAGGYYQTQDYGEYSEARTEELLSQGIDIDLSPIGD